MCAVSILIGLFGIAAGSSAGTVFTKASYIQYTYPYFYSVLLYSDYSTLPWRYFYRTPANGCIETKLCTLRAELQTDTAPMFGGYQYSTAALNSLHCSIRSKIKVNFADVCGFDTRRAPRNCSRFVCWCGFHEDVLVSVYVPILLYCCTRIT